MKLRFAQLSPLDRDLPLVDADVLPGNDHDVVTTSIRHAYGAMTTAHSVSDLTDASPYPLHALAMSAANVDELVSHPSDVRFDVENCAYRPVAYDRDVEVPGNSIYAWKSHWLVYPDLRIAWQINSKPVSDQFFQRGRNRGGTAAPDPWMRELWSFGIAVKSDCSRDEIRWTHSRVVPVGNCHSASDLHSVSALVGALNRQLLTSSALVGALNRQLLTSTLTLTGRGERMRASGPVERVGRERRQLSPVGFACAVAVGTPRFPSSRSCQMGIQTSPSRS